MRPCSRKTCRNTLTYSWLDSCDPGTRTATIGRFAAVCAVLSRGHADTTIPASRLMNLRRRIRPPVRSCNWREQCRPARRRSHQWTTDRPGKVHRLKVEVEPRRIQEVLDRDPPHDGGPKCG